MNERVIRALEEAAKQWKAQNLMAYMSKFGYTESTMKTIQDLLGIKEKR